MKVCVVGAGAIGGFIGARLAQAAQCDLSALARGATLAALRQHGWRLQTAHGFVQAPAQASDSASALGPQDLVVIAVKGPALPAVAAQLSPLLGPDTLVMPAMNGVPWWFLQTAGRPTDPPADGLEGHPAMGAQPLHSVDPDGAVSAAIALRRVLGCVVHASTAMPEPGLVAHRMGQGLIIGEPVGGHSARAQRVVDLMAAAGFDATHSGNIRQDIWYKLWGNLTMNPVSALTGATGDVLLADPLVRAFFSAGMEEAAAVGARIGVPIAQSPEDRHAITAKLGALRTSMLQDVEAGRPIELDAIVTVVHEIARRVGVATPHIDAMLGLTRVFARVRGLLPPSSPAPGLAPNA
jgi:2-dehydropantoate 2-reductase